MMIPENSKECNATVQPSAFHHSASHFERRGGAPQTRPKAPAPKIENIPVELKALPQWALWRYEFISDRWTKIPLRAGGRGKASSTDSNTWASFEEAITAYARCRGVDGIGFVVTDQDRVVGVDLDHVCDDAGAIEPWAQEIVGQLDTYCEWSPSGEGLRLFAFGALPTGRRKVGDIETYDRARFLTVTGHRLGDLKPMAERTDELATFHAEYLCPKPAPRTTTQRAAHRPTEVRDGKPLSDREIVIGMLSSKPGARLRALWRGDWEGMYSSQSEADLALVSALLWWCQGDIARVDRLFRESGLYRDKWDRSDYQDRTISKIVGQ